MAQSHGAYWTVWTENHKAQLKVNVNTKHYTMNEKHEKLFI